MYDKFVYKTYDQYLTVQTQHARTKSRTVDRHGNRHLDIDLIKSYFPGAAKVLCVGARDRSEVLDFSAAGFFSTGIDLFSSCEEIKIIDMHHLSSHFSHKSFDVVYMSHSLEHSYDPCVVLNEVRQVCSTGCLFVLPVQTAPTQKDPTVFQFMKNKKSTIYDVQEELNSILNWSLEIVAVHCRPFVIAPADELVIVARV